MRSWRAAALASSTLALGALVLVLRAPNASVRWARAVARHLMGRKAQFTRAVDAERFLRGNVHTHSRASDGTATTEAMVRWYRDHGYAFLAMTEHNRRVDPAGLAAEAAPMVLVAGEEVTNTVHGTPLHVNSLCAREEVGGDTDFPSTEAGLRDMVNAIRARGGIPLVNHPNFHWAIGLRDLTRGVSGRYLLEIWSGHPNVSPAGNGDHPSAEAIWDGVLSAGADVSPVAVDDAHGLPDDPAGGDALPGRAWIDTFGDERTPEAICAALAAGDLYASSGAELARIAVGGDAFTVVATDPGATVAFLGERGEVLGQTGAKATYRLMGGETWVRARAIDARGRRAWTPAYRVEAR